ncbi:MAG: septal ring lytic transglycosylase RlpA family protein [Bryobacteraceae bacterium]
MLASGQMTRRAAIALSAVLLAASCAKKKRAAAPPPFRPGYTETGIASWYGHPYHGRASASGEIYDMEKLTAAHRTLPFGTMVRVHNLDNGRSVDVRIIDRGPFVNGRIVDLSHAAAREVAMIGTGTANVRLEILALGIEAAPGYYAVQVGAFRERANAELRRKEMEKRYGAARLLLRDGNPPLWRVVIGRMANMDEAVDLAARIESETGAAFVVRLDGPQSDL